MDAVVHIFSCPRCNRGGFRSLPGADGRAHCPWCGDLVPGGIATPSEPAPTRAPTLAAGSPAPSPVLPDAALRDRLAEVERKCEQAESELRRELDKKQEIKRAVLMEMAQLSAQLAESKASLQRKEEEFVAVLLEAKGLRDELAQERKRAEDVLAARGSLEDKVTAANSLADDLEACRKSLKEAREARDGAGRDTEQARSELAKAKNNAAVELAELRKKLAAAESRVSALKGSGDELKGLKARHEEYRGRMERDHLALSDKTKALQTDLEKRDQRIRDLQLLIKTLGERLNDLTSRHY